MRSPPTLPPPPPKKKFETCTHTYTRFHTFDIRASTLDNQFVYILNGNEMGHWWTDFWGKLSRDHGLQITWLQLKCVKSVQSTLSHQITTSVPRVMFTHFLLEHGLILFIFN